MGSLYSTTLYKAAMVACLRAQKSVAARQLWCIEAALLETSSVSGKQLLQVSHQQHVLYGPLLMLPPPPPGPSPGLCMVIVSNVCCIRLAVSHNVLMYKAGKESIPAVELVRLDFWGCRKGRQEPQPEPVLVRCHTARPQSVL